MSTFKVGEVAIGCGFEFATEYNGMECTIVDGLKDFAFTICATTGLLLPACQCYFAEWANGTCANVDPLNLRKRRPPGTDEAERLTAELFDRLTQRVSA